MLNDSFFRLTCYMGAHDNYEEACAVLAGVPMDFTASNRTGSRSAPQQVRNVSYVLEEYSVYLDKSLADLSYYDAGDIALPFGNVKESLRIIEEVAKKIFNDKKFPLFIGGDHLVSYPLIKACHSIYPELTVLHFDAHADLRTEYENEKDSHATVMFKVAELLGPGRLFQFGIRSGIKEEFDYAGKNTTIFYDEIFPALDRIVEQEQGKPVYLSIDIDVVDPAFAPGTGTPEPGGCTSREILSAVRALSPLNVVGMDLVEILPASDSAEITAVLGAKIIREALLSYVRPR